MIENIPMGVWAPTDVPDVDFILYPAPDHVVSLYYKLMHPGSDEVSSHYLYRAMLDAHPEPDYVWGEINKTAERMAYKVEILQKYIDSPSFKKNLKSAFKNLRSA